MKKILSVSVLAIGMFAYSGTDAKADSFSISFGNPYYQVYPAPLTSFGYYHPAPAYYGYYAPKRYYKPHRKYYNRGYHRGYKHGYNKHNKYHFRGNDRWHRR